MTTILELNSSIHSREAASSRMADGLVERLQAATPGARLIRRDLAAEPIPHLDAQTFKAFGTQPGERDTQQRQLAELSDRLVGELRSADVLVIGLPMYNFGIPSTLKAWFDHVARAGQTFKYTDKGPVGLMTGKKAYVVATRGGRYAGTATDLQSQYVRNFLGFLGISDVEFVYAEGLAMGPEARENSLARARTQLRQIQIPERLAA